MRESSDQTVSELMSRLRQGDHSATRQLFDLLYPELRRLAAIRMSRERADHSWQPTALVNELYLELLKIKSLKSGESAEEEKQAFFRLAAFLMRRLLIHHSRPLYRRAEKLPIEETPFEALSGSTPDNESLIDIENTLNRLAAIKPEMRRVVELRVFEGQTVDEAATELGCSPRTVDRYWNFAQHWLHQQLSAAPKGG